MAVSKVALDSTTLIDLTNDTAVASDVAYGKTFHLADGNIATGTKRDDALAAISITHLPTTEYMVGDSLDLTGLAVTAIYANGTTATASGYTTVPANGTTLTTSMTSVTVSYTEGGITRTASFGITVEDITIVTWANGSASDIAKMVADASAGKIRLSDYWAVGNVRTVTLPAIPSTNVGESQSSQEVDLVLMDTTCQGFVRADTNAKPEFIVGLKDGLSTAGYMNSSNTNSGGWRDCKRRTWCNSNFKTAIDSVLPNVFHQFTWQTGKGGGSSSGLYSCTDYFGLPPAKAIFGSDSYSFSDEAALYSQWTWYATSSNRVKKRGKTGSAGAWWECSASSGRSKYFCFVYSDGSAGSYDASDAYSLAPFGCI